MLHITLQHYQNAWIYRICLQLTEHTDGTTVMFGLNSVKLHVNTNGSYYAKGGQPAKEVEEWMINNVYILVIHLSTTASHNMQHHYHHYKIVLFIIVISIIIISTLTSAN